MVLNNKSQVSSLETYKKLTGELGKDFVDQSILSIIGFDETLDIAEYGDVGTDKIQNISTEIANILSDKGGAIIFARKKIMEANKQNFEKYFGMFLNDKLNIDDLRRLMSNMIDKMNSSIDINSLEEAYFDFMFLFTFSGELKYRCPQIFGNPEHMLGITILPNENIEKYIKDTEFKDKFLNFLNRFYNKINNSNNQDKLKIYFISEIMRIQSGQREGIGNSMNPMIQFMTIDDLFGNGYLSEVNGLLKKLIFKRKQNVPGTPENIRKKIGNILQKIISDYMFPRKYSKY